MTTIPTNRTVILTARGRVRPAPGTRRHVPTSHRAPVTVTRHLTTRGRIRVLAIAAIVMAVILAAFAIGVATSGTAHATTPDRAPSRTACATEDSAGPCYWNATTQGSHGGVSFWRGADGRTHRVNAHGRTRCVFSDGNPTGTACYRQPSHGVAFWVSGTGVIRYVDGAMYRLENYS